MAKEQVEQMMIVSYMNERSSRRDEIEPTACRVRLNVDAVKHASTREFGRRPR